jgi:nitrate reductase gamma subunit
VLACLLLFGMAIGLVRLVLGLTAVSRYRRFSCPLDDPELADLLAIVRAELGCTRSVAIHESAALDAPAVIGWLRPLVLLPETWRSWTQDECRAVLAHEVAHISHNDYVSWMLAQVSLIVNFYNPLVHWLVGRLRIEQELAADGCGARLAGGNQTYLTILAGMALRLDNRQASWAARPFLPARGTFLRRIEMLRDTKSVGQPQLAFVSRVLVVGALGVAALFAAGLRAPLAGGSTNLLSSEAVGLADGEKTPITGEFIPPNAIAAVAIRVPDLLRQLGTKDLAAFIEDVSQLKQLGIHLEELEEVKLAFVAPQANGGGPSEQFFLRSIKPLDWIAAFRKEDPNQEAIEYNGAKYYKSSSRKGGIDQAIYMPDERSIVGGSEARIRDLILSGGKAARPTWADGWDKFSGGQVAAMIDAEAFVRLMNAERGGRNPNDPMFTLFAPLWENSKVAFVGINLNKNLVITVKSESPSEEAAQKVSKNLQAVETFAENGLDGLGKQLEHAQMPKQEKDMFLQLLGVGKDLLEHVRITQQGTSVSVQTQSDKIGPDTIAGLLIPAAQKMRSSAKRSMSANNLKQIALAMHNYHSVHNCFPPAVIMGPDGKTPHSWRVELLPFLEQTQLYQSYKMDEPWDSENNRKILAQMPRTFSADSGAVTTTTSYFVLTGKDTIFSGKEGTKIQDITDGTSNTILVVEAKGDVPWTKPVDLAYDAKKPLPKFGGYFTEGFNAAFADGSVHFIVPATAEQTLRAMITKAGGEVIPQP